MPSPRRPWSATLEVTPHAITVVVREPEGADVVTAVFSGYPDHPRALLTLLEGLALWSAPMCAAISAAHPVSHSLGLGSCGDLERWPEERALVSVQCVETARRRRRIGWIRSSQRMADAS